MSKRKGHLYTTEGLVGAVMLEESIRAMCGYETTFTRDDINDPRERDLCKHCIAVEAKNSNGLVRFHSQTDWVGTLERAWREMYEASLKSQWTFTYNTTTRNW